MSLGVYPVVLIVLLLIHMADTLDRTTSRSLMWQCGLTLSMQRQCHTNTLIIGYIFIIRRSPSLFHAPFHVYHHAPFMVSQSASDTFLHEHLWTSETGTHVVCVSPCIVRFEATSIN